MSKAQNLFHLTHSNQITLIQLAPVYHTFQDEKNKITIFSAMNVECYWWYAPIFFIMKMKQLKNAGNFVHKEWHFTNQETSILAKTRDMNK